MINSNYLRSVSVKGTSQVYKEGEEERICTKCPLPAKNCNGECERYKKLKRKIKGVAK